MKKMVMLEVDYNPAKHDDPAEWDWSTLADTPVVVHGAADMISPAHTSRLAEIREAVRAVLPWAKTLHFQDDTGSFFHVYAATAVDGPGPVRTRALLAHRLGEDLLDDIGAELTWLTSSSRYCYGSIDLDTGEATWSDTPTDLSA